MKKNTLADNTTEMTLSVIMPVHQLDGSVKKCMEAILQARPAPSELIIVADGCSLDLKEIIDHPLVSYLQTEVPAGPASARNFGARAAQGKLLCFIDSDVLITPGLFKKIVSNFEVYQDVAALFGSYDDAPSAVNFLSQYRNLLHHYVHQHSSPEAFTFWTGCGSIRSSVFKQVGGFDALRYPQPAIEDIELGYRLTGAGYRIRLCKDLQVKHLKKWTAPSILQVDFYRRALPWATLMLRHRNLGKDLNLKLSNKISVACIFVLLLSIPMTLIWPISLWLAAGSAAVLLWLNAPLYRFFAKKRGGLFALRVIPWHWLFYGLSGLAFGCALSNYFIEKSVKVWTKLPSWSGT